MKRVLVASIFALLAACGGGGSAPVTVDLNADSLFTGPGLREPIPAALKRLAPGLVLDDRSVAGLTLGDCVTGYDRISPLHDPLPDCARLPFALAKRTSQVIVIELGINDALAQSWRPDFTPEGYERDLRAVIALIRSEGRVPVLTGLVQVPEQPGMFDKSTQDRLTMLRQIIRRVATETGTIHADFESVRFDGLVDTVDGAHRTQVASDRLAERLAQVLTGEVK